MLQIRLYIDEGGEPVDHSGVFTQADKDTIKRWFRSGNYRHRISYVAAFSPIQKLQGTLEDIEDEFSVDQPELFTSDGQHFWFYGGNDRGVEFGDSQRDGFERGFSYALSWCDKNLINI